MNISDISTEWTPTERLAAISHLAKEKREQLRSGGHFSQRDWYDVMDRVEIITRSSAGLLEANRQGLFRDIRDYAKQEARP